MEGRQEERERMRSERQAAEATAAAAMARKRRVQYLTIAGFAAVAVIVALIVISQSGGDGDGGGTPSNVSGVGQVDAELQGIPQHGQTLGQAGASVTVTEFGDPQCPVCAAFARQIAPELITSEVKTGDAKLVFEPYLIIGPDSTPAMKATLAAGEQGRFWNYLQLFYANQGQENSGYVTDEFLTNIAKAAGISDINAWDRSRSSSQWDSVLSGGTSKAESFGFNGTPSIVVKGPNGEKALSGFGLSEIQAAIQQVS